MAPVTERGNFWRWAVGGWNVAGVEKVPFSCTTKDHGATPENPSSKRAEISEQKSGPSLKIFILSELTFSPKDQSNYSGQIAAALRQAHQSSEERSQQGRPGQAMSQFPGWDSGSSVDCSSQPQCIRPWAKLCVRITERSCLLFLLLRTWQFV